jgi:cytochrome c oxidase assembly protein subunit 15
VPDWPLSFGQVFPPMRGLMVWEHGHRLLAGSVAILSVILTLWITFTEKRKWLIGVAWLSVGLVFLQALLGGLTVLLKLPPAISIAHAVLGQTFFGLVVATAFFMSPYYEGARFGAAQLRNARFIRLAVSCLALVFIQLILGATVRHTGHAVIEHIVFAVVVTGHILALAFYAIRRHPAQKNLLRLVIGSAGVLVTQIFLGIGAYALTRLVPDARAPTTAKVLFTAFHQTLGAVLLGLLVIACLVAFYPEEEK